MTTTSHKINHPVVLLGGGIGAGKSRVAEVFAERGFDVIEADKVGHGILAYDVGVIAAVAARWPGAVEGGVVDRASLAEAVFGDPEGLAELEAITHPAIADELKRRIESAFGPVVVEIPLTKVLVGGSPRRVALVADTDTREDRAVARGTSRDDVRRRMRHQLTDEQWRSWADDVIDNSGLWDTTAESVHALIDRILTDG